MNKWPSVPLASAIKHRKQFILIDDLAKYKRCRVQLHAQGIVLRDTVSGSEIKTKKQQICKAGDFLVAEIDAKVGGFGIVPNELESAVVSSHYFLFEINNAVLEQRFLDFFIRTPAFREQVTAQGSTNYAAIRPDDVLEYKIPLPPLPVQRRIVARIEELAAKIAEAFSLNVCAIEEAETLSLSVIRAAFNSIPNFQRLGEPRVAKIICGQHLTPEEQAGNGIPYITGPADFGARIARPSRFTRVAKALARPGDVLLTVKGAGVGKVNLAPELPTVIGRQLFAIRPTAENLDQDFLWYALQFKLGHLREAITATTVPGIGRDDVESLEIPILSLSEQRSIVAYLDELQAKVDTLKKLQAETAAELDAMLPSILDKAFKGEIP